MTDTNPADYPPEIIDLPDPDADGLIPATPAPKENE